MKHRIFPIAGLIAAGLWAAWGAGSASTRAAAGPEGQISVAGGQVALGTNGIHPPLAYGRINDDASISSASTNVAGVSKPLTGTYDITIDGGLASTDVILVTVAVSFPNWAVAKVLGNGKARVTIWNIGPDTFDLPFSFVIFRP